jgi:hypothetical protein
MMTLATNYIGQARGSLAMEAVERVAGPGSSSANDAGTVAMIDEEEVQP